MILLEEKKVICLDGKSIDFPFEIQISRSWLFQPMGEVKFNLIKEINTMRITDAIAAGYCFSACFLAGPLLKYVETLEVTFEKMSNNDVISKTAYFNSQTKIIINDSNIAESLESSEQELLNKVAVWISEGSGWTIESINNHYLNVVKYEPMKGSSYIKLPQELRNSVKGLINMKNYDNECFRYCHIRHLNPQAKYPQRIKKVDKAFIENLNYSGIEFPVTTKQYNKIEKQNDININVFGYENKQRYPIYISKEENEDCLNLLLITENENKHYVLIKDFNKFLYNQTKQRKHFCMHCLQCFSSEKVLANHKENCIQINGTQAIRMPTKKDNILKFNNFHKQQSVIFVIYADFEAITEKIHGCQPNDNKSEVKKLFTNLWKLC